MNHPPRTPSRASTVASQDSRISNAQHAALSGATKAFGRPMPPQKASSNRHPGDYGARAAAATVGSRQSSPVGRLLTRPPAQPLVTSSTGGSAQSVKSNAIHNGSALVSGQKTSLRPPAMDRTQQSKSPSSQAASLAASRATPQPQQHQYQAAKASSAKTKALYKPAAPPKPRRLSEHNSMDSSEDADRLTDQTSFPSTTALVDLFEQRSNHSARNLGRPEPIVLKPSKSIPIKSPKPVRTSGGLTSVFQMELPLNAPAGPKLEPAPDTEPSKSRSSSDSFASASEDPTASSSPEIVTKDRVPSAACVPGSTKEESPPILVEQRKPPSSPPPRSKIVKPMPIRDPLPRSSTMMSDRLSPSSASVKSLPAQFNQLHPRGKVSQIGRDQLANAMVASSLASSRGPSPSHAEPPPLPSQRQQRHHVFGFSRTPSPSKGGMRHTLRKAETDEETDEEDLLHPYGKHKKKRHLRKHPNKHNEGDRKRWRDAVTERERKRYEGVWAANKGLYCSLTRSEQASINESPSSEEAQALQDALGDQVSNVIAREVWSRSRLPVATLETVWELVDNDCVGRLTKEEFCVGMFLIDYCLKGRKLPIKVSESVWASVRSLQGIKVKK